MKKNLPIYALEISEDMNEDSGVSYVAMVDKPAIEADFFAFAESPMLLQFSGDDEMVIIGPAMIPDKPIYRNENGQEFFITFSKDAISRAAVKFFEQGFQKKINLMHSPDFKIEGVTIFQSFIKDEAKGVGGMVGDYPDGTWFLGAKVRNPEAWQLIKAGKVKGWSVEGLFKPKRNKLSIDEVWNSVAALVADV